MADKIQRIAVYTTIYPGVEKYLPDWYRSIQSQSDQNFQLWIGLDGIEAQAVKSAIGYDLEAVWVRSELGETPTRIRQRSLTQIVDNFDAVVLVDSDDILHPSRVAAARLALQDSDLTACALRLVDKHRRDLGMTLTLPPQTVPDEILPRSNVFGFSNSAFRSGLLRRCLPIPQTAMLVDWLLATRAWLLGAKIHFDEIVRMDYRQHEANTAPIRFPYDADRVIGDTGKVREHFYLLQNSPIPGTLPHRWAQVRQVANDVQLFFQQVALQPAKLEKYILNLNALPQQTIWWRDVAHPALRWMWRDHAELQYDQISQN